MVNIRVPRPLAYKLIAFGSGFALMSYELAGSRLLTPVIGSSTYVWTGIIGVIVAALSVGYMAGGKLADQRNSHRDIVWILLLASITAVSTLLLVQPASDLLAVLRLDIRLEAVLASAVLFAPTSVLLGSLSPYIAKLHTTSLKTAGSSIASLSALNALGSIAGTFLTGFVLFGFVGSRATVTLVVVLLVLLGTIASLAGSHPRIDKSSLLVIIIGLLLIPAQATNLVAALDTPHANYQVRDIQRNNRTVRVLTMGPGGYQSGIYLDNPSELAFQYSNRIADTIKTLDEPDRVLVLGGGTFTLPQYLATTYPDAHVDAVELDSDLTDLAQKYFAFEQPANLTIINEDARVFMSQSSSDPYDIIIVDVFSDSGVPFSITTREFTEQLAAGLSPDGIVMMNVIAGTNSACNPLLQSIAGTFVGSFNHVGLSPVQAETLETRQNVLLLASQELHPPIATSSAPQENAGQLLSDDFAPIERLHHNCLASN